MKHQTKLIHKHVLGEDMESNRYKAVKCHLHSCDVFSDTAAMSLISVTL